MKIAAHQMTAINYRLALILLLTGCSPAEPAPLQINIANKRLYTEKITNYFSVHYLKEKTRIK